MTASNRSYFCTGLFSFLLIDLGNASRHIFPTPTFADFRAADAQYNLLPTPNAWTPSDLSKRLAGDPALCGWIEGDYLNSISCHSGWTCASEKTFIGCCPISSSRCDIVTTCYDERSTNCNDECSTDSSALLCTETDRPYCGIYQYTSGFQGYGCAAYTDFTKAVLTTTTSSGAEPTTKPTATPFDKPSTSTTVTASSTSGSISVFTVSPTPPPKQMSGGAIAGTVVGSVVGLAAISLMLLFIFQRLRKRKNRRQRKQTSGGPYHVQDQPLYDQYGKPVYSPLWSPQGHSRHQSDGQSELEGTTVSPNPNKSPLASPGISEVDGRALSPDPDSGSPPMNHGFSAGSGHQNRLAELPGAN